MITQSTPYGSGIYAIANALDMPTFLTAQRLIDSAPAITPFELSVMLLEDTKDLLLDPIWVDYTDGTTMPEWIDNIEVQYNKKTMFIPFLIGVKVNETANIHFVSGRKQADGTFVLFDSLKGSPVVLNSISGITGMYYKICSIYLVISKITKEAQMMTPGINQNNN